MSTNRKKLRAHTPVRLRRRPDGVRNVTTVPADVLAHLDAGAEDSLIFEDGCEGNVTRAAISGPYVIVRRGPRPGDVRQAGEVMPHGSTKESAPTSALAPFHDHVKRQCGRAGDPVDGTTRRASEECEP